jgi:hypothetical protein
MNSPCNDILLLNNCDSCEAKDTSSTAWESV